MWIPSTAAAILGYRRRDPPSRAVVPSVNSAVKFRASFSKALIHFRTIDSAEANADTPLAVEDSESVAVVYAGDQGEEFSGSQTTSRENAEWEETFPSRTKRFDVAPGRRHRRLPAFKTPDFSRRHCAIGEDQWFY
jgi:hypothetical protein